MNIAKPKIARKINDTQDSVSIPVSIMVRLGALGIVAGASFAAPAVAGENAKGTQACGAAAVDEPTGREIPSDDLTPVETVPADRTPAPDAVTTIDTAPIADVPEPKAVEPKTPGPITPDVPATQPVFHVAPTTQPTMPDAPVTAPATTAPVATPPAITPASPAPVVHVMPISRPAPATQPVPVSTIIANGLDEDGSIHMNVNESRIITTKVPYTQVHVPAEDVAFPILRQTGQSAGKEILLEAKKPGSTQLVIWDDANRSQVVHVVVGYDLFGLDKQLKEMFPKAAIKVDVAKGVIVLRGHVPDLLTAQQAAQVAGPYSGGVGTGILNFLEVSGGQQVVLQVRFAEVTRTVQQNLGFNAFATDGKFAFGAGNGPIGSQPTIGNAGTNASAFPLYGGAMMGNTSFEYFITALRTNGLLRILAEPNLTAISGQQASFLAGGEIPILVPQASGGGSVTTVDYKQYGIQLNFTPTVLGDGRIRLLCTPQVSDLDYAHSVDVGGSPVPALTTRNVNTTVELAEGQTFALAGLLKNEITANKNVTPVLGDLPVLGALFRSVSYNRQETELVVLVTPHMVEALNPSQVPHLPGDPWRDPTEAQLFGNGDLGGPAPDTRHAPTVRSSRFYGFTGYAPATPPAGMK